MAILHIIVHFITDLARASMYDVEREFRDSSDPQVNLRFPTSSSHMDIYYVVIPPDENVSRAVVKIH